MAAQHKALADATELTDTVYFLHPTGNQTLNPWFSKQRHCILTLKITCSEDIHSILIIIIGINQFLPNNIINVFRNNGTYFENKIYLPLK